MRFYLLTILCVLAMGCNSDPNCRRETALLRSEILDLEDKYYMLKSERDALAQGQGFAQDSIYSEGSIYPEGQLIHEGHPIEGQFLGDQTPYEQPYEQEIAYADGQAYFVDTGEPYYGEPSHGTAGYGTAGYGMVSDGDPDIVYENEMPYEGSVDHAEQPSLVQSEVRLAPDDSILPLYSGETGGIESDTYAEDFDLRPELDSKTSNEELNLLLEPPSDIETELDQSEFEEITEVVINRLATQGHDIDGVPGDEGLDLLIQPRSADGQVQLIPGELTVSVIDPTQSTDKQRIGLWKFVGSETELFFANNELGNYGILLHLPWDQETPVNKKLTVHVRFIPEGGQTFETATEIRIDPPQANYSPNDPLVTGWTRSDSRWNLELGSSTHRSRSNGSDNSNWIRRRTATPVRAQVQAAGQTDRRKIQALPAKATIKKPAWRPTR